MEDLYIIETIPMNEVGKPNAHIIMTSGQIIGEVKANNIRKVLNAADPRFYNRMIKV